MSREEHDDDLRKQRGDDMKLQMALDESVKEQVGGARGRGQEAGLGGWWKQRGDDMKLQMALDESVKEQVGGARGRG